MQTYEKYKYSGVEWIGKVPEHWQIRRLKTDTFLKGRIGWNGLRSDEFKESSYAYLVTGQDFTGPNINWDKCYQIDKDRYDEDPFIQLQNGDILITKDGTIGKISKVSRMDKPACLNSGIFVMKQRSSHLYEQGYIYWLLTSNLLKEYNQYTSTGTTILHLYQNVFENMPLLIPTLLEQQAISSYLDKKCADIDKVIATQQRRIELLQELKQSTITHAVTRGLNPNAKMKDSGVEWIGEVPEHWEITKVSNVCNVVTDFVASGSFADLAKNVTYLDEPDYAMLIRTADLSQKNKSISKVYINKASYDFLSNSNLFGGEIVLPNIGASIGDVYMIEKKMYEKMSLAPNSIMLKTKYHDKFYYYLFKSKPGRESLQLIGQASAQGKFNKTDLRKLRVLIPPITEQIEIVKAIEKALKPLDASISKAQKEIDLLQEYKQALISEVVTGKRKVC